MLTNLRSWDFFFTFIGRNFYQKRGIERIICRSGSVNYYYYYNIRDDETQTFHFTLICAGIANVKCVLNMRL